MKKLNILLIVTYILLILLILPSLIMIILARLWKCQENYLFRNKSPFEGVDSNQIKNLIINGLNEMVVLSIPKKYNKPFLPWQELYPQVNILQKYWKNIQKEAKVVMNIAPSYHDVDQRNTGLSTHDNRYWKTFILKYYKGFNKKNCEKCPQTTSLLKQLPKVNLAMFSILEPGKILYPQWTMGWNYENSFRSNYTKIKSIY